MREIDCPLCEGKDSTLVETHVGDACLPPHVRVTTVVCQRCGFVYQDPQPEEADLRALYEDYHGTRKFAPEAEYIDRKDYDALRKLKWIRERKPDLLAKKGRCLEVGAAAGNFMLALREEGWTVEGLEPTTAYAQYAREAYGLDVKTGVIEEVEWPNGTFDLITLGEVLEHLPDPVGKLRRMREWLKPDGHVYIDVPNVAQPVRLSLSYYFRGEHLNHFSPTTLRLALEKAGFEIVADKAHFYQYVIAKRAAPRTIDYAKEGETPAVVMRRIRTRRPRVYRWLVKKAAKRVVVKLLGGQRGHRLIYRIGEVVEGGKR